MTRSRLEAARLSPKHAGVLPAGCVHACGCAVGCVACSKLRASPGEPGRHKTHPSDRQAVLLQSVRKLCYLPSPQGEAQGAKHHECFQHEK